MEETNLRKWEITGGETVFEALPWVKVVKESVCLPGGRCVDDFYKVEFPEYAIICAEDETGSVLFQRQYKPALDKISWSFPSGCCEPGEEPLATAQRELLEETGFRAAWWQTLGSFVTDGNKGCGRAHMFLAADLKKIQDPVVDDMEEMENVFVTKERLAELLRKGDIEILAAAALAALVLNPSLRS